MTPPPPIESHDKGDGGFPPLSSLPPAKQSDQSPSAGLLDYMRSHSGDCVVCIVAYLSFLAIQCHSISLYDYSTEMCTICFN